MWPEEGIIDLTGPPQRWLRFPEATDNTPIDLTGDDDEEDGAKAAPLLPQTPAGNGGPNALQSSFVNNIRDVKDPAPLSEGHKAVAGSIEQQQLLRLDKKAKNDAEAMRNEQEGQPDRDRELPAVLEAKDATGGALANSRHLPKEPTAGAKEAMAAGKPQPSSKDETEDGKELEQCRRPRQEAVARGGETDQLEQRVPVQSSPRQSESTGAAAEGDEGEAEGTAWRHPWELAVSDNTVRDMHRTGFRRRKFKGAEQQRGKPPDEEEQQGFKGQESCFASAFSSENGEERQSRPHRYIGCRVRKEFHGVPYEGTIDGWDPFICKEGWWHVTYDDGDDEELSLLEIHRYMLKPRKKGQRKPTGALEAGDEAARSKFLVCEDISRGQEPNTKVPVYNELADNAALPEFRYITQNIIPGGVRHVIQEAAESVDRFFILGWEERGRCRGVTRRAPDKAVEIFNNVGHLTKTTPNGISEIGAPAAKQVVSKGHTLPLEVFMTKNKGWGLRCKERIPIGAFVCEYVGEVIKEGDVCKGHDEYIFGLDHYHEMFLNTVDKERDIGDLDDETLASWMHRCKASGAPLQVNAAHAGNLARFINDDCENPNCCIMPVFTDEQMHSTVFYRICIFALEEIEPMTELTYDYGYHHHGVSCQWRPQGEQMHQGSTSMAHPSRNAKQQDRLRCERRRAQLFRGVYKHKDCSGYNSNVCLKTSKVYLGRFPTAVEAARARDKQAVRLQGPKAAQMLNFPISDYAAELEAFREAGPQQLPSASRPSKRPRGDENLRDGPRKSIRRQGRLLVAHKSSLPELKASRTTAATGATPAMDAACRGVKRLSNGKWRAWIHVKDVQGALRNTTIGYFNTAEEAIQARKKKEMERNSPLGNAGAPPTTTPSYGGRSWDAAGSVSSFRGLHPQPGTRAGPNGEDIRGGLFGTEEALELKDGDVLNFPEVEAGRSAPPASAIGGEKDAKGGKKYRGLYQEKTGKWRATVWHKGKCICIGSFTTPEEAARAYDRKVLELKGPGTKLNFGLGGIGAGALAASAGCPPPPAPSVANSSRIRTVSASGYRGVYPHATKWSAQIGHNGGTIRIGIFDTAEEAAQARDFKALELKGQGALLNFPEVATGPRAPPGGMGGAQPFQEYRSSACKALGQWRLQMIEQGTNLGASGAHKAAEEGSSGVERRTGDLDLLSPPDDARPAKTSSQLPEGVTRAQPQHRDTGLPGGEIHSLGPFATVEEAFALSPTGARACDHRGPVAVPTFPRDGVGLRNDSAMSLVSCPPAAEATADARGVGGVPKYRGVTLNGKRWMAQVYHDRKMRYNGSFNSAEEAARAYDILALQLKGPDAKLNFPQNSGAGRSGYAAPARPPSAAISVASLSRDGKAPEDLMQGCPSDESRRSDCFQPVVEASQECNGEAFARRDPETLFNFPQDNGDAHPRAAAPPAAAEPMGGSGQDKTEGRPKYQGASFETGTRRVQVNHEGENYTSGPYATAEEAARAYDKQASELKGPTAVLRFPGGASSAPDTVSRSVAVPQLQALKAEPVQHGMVLDCVRSPLGGSVTATPVSANAARGAMQEERNGIHWGHDMPLDFDASLVGRSIEIMWPMGSQTQRLATIEGYDEATRLHQVEFGPTHTEWLLLWRQNVRWLPAPSGGSSGGSSAGSQQPSTRWMGGRGESDWVADPRVLANGTRVRIIADGRTGEIFRMIMVAVRFGSLPSAWGIEPRYMVLLSGRTCKSFSPDDIEPLLDHPPPNGWDTQESKELQLSRGSLPAQFRSHSS